MTGTIKQVTDDSFQEDVLQSETPVVVDFWAPWCGPCRMVAPVVEDLAREYEGQVVFTKMNTDENTDTAAKLGIRGIPTLIVFANGEEADRLVGFAPKPVLKRKLEAILSEVNAE